MNRQFYQRSIINSLAWISKEVEFNNGINFTDINVHSENFYRDFLNKLFGYKLVNINIAEPNATAIDLGDEGSKFAIQVTSTSAKSKTVHTVEKFIENKLHDKYDRLVILNISKKTDHREPKITFKEYSLDTKDDIWDIHTLVKECNNLDDNRLKEIHEFLNEQLYLKPSEDLPKNVKTILTLIELLSDENHPLVGEGFITEPDPDGKINKRFSDHADYLKNEYVSLHKDYGAVLDSVEEESDIGQVKIRRLAQHLRVYSDKVLTECNDDPKLALSKIIDHFIGQLTSEGIEADTGAAQFFIVKHLVRCNVFPNKDTENA